MEFIVYSSGVETLCILFYPHNNLVGWIAIVSFYNQKEIMFSKLQRPLFLTTLRKGMCLWQWERI